VFAADQNARMTTDAESRLMTLKERLEQGQYNVDATKVADAIVRNPLWIMLFVAGGGHASDSRPAVG
jgi:hypothetical protein